MKKVLLSICFVLFGILSKAETVRILGIGNSYTVDAVEVHFQPILDSMGIDAIVGYPYHGGYALSEHVRCMNIDTLAYNYRKFTHGVYSSTGEGTYKLIDAIKDEPWDYVVIQTDYDSSGVAKSYYPWIDTLVSRVRRYCSNKEVKVGLYMTWACDSISTKDFFKKMYKGNTQLMYDSIVKNVQMVMSKSDFDFMIPVGTAVQNARTSYKGHTLNRDGYHLNYDYGRYIAGLGWYTTIFDDLASNVPYYPSTITEYCARMCRAAVDSALLKPYQQTSLAANFSKTDEEEASKSDDSSMKRISVNGMRVMLYDDTHTYIVPVRASKDSIDVLLKATSTTASFNVTLGAGDIENDPLRPGYYTVKTPQLNDTTTIQVRVIAADLKHTTSYILRFVGQEDKDLDYPIWDIEDLKAFADVVNGGFYGLNAHLATSFDAGLTQQACWKTPIGTAEHPYTGVFDGNGYTISGYVIYAVDDPTLYAYEAIGLFGTIQNATIKGLTLKGTTESYFNRPSSNSITSKVSKSGLLCGSMICSTIQDCSVYCPIFTNLDGAVGAICGFEQSKGTASTIQRCHSTGTWRIRRSGQYAGILAYGYNVTITDCYSMCVFNLQRDFAARIGGILAYVNASSGRSVTIKNCYFNGKITDARESQGVTTAQTIYFGAIASVFNGTQVFTSNCYYVDGSASAEFGQHKNYTTKQSATKVTKTNLTDGSLTTNLGSAFTQGNNYPVLIPVEHKPEPRPKPDIPASLETQFTDSPIQHSKFMRNGQLLIIKDDQTYTAQGTRL